VASNQFPPVSKLLAGMIQLDHNRPVEPTGMNWLLPIYWSSTAEPWLPQMVPAAVVAVLGCGMTLQ